MARTMTMTFGHVGSSQSRRVGSVASGRVGSCHGPGREGKVALQPFWVEMPPPHPPPPAGISLAGLIRACSSPKMYPVIVIVESWTGRVVSWGRVGLWSGREGKVALPSFWVKMPPSTPPPTPCRHFASQPLGYGRVESGRSVFDCVYPKVVRGLQPASQSDSLRKPDQYSDA